MFMITMKVPIRIHRALVRGPLLRSHFHTAHALLAARKVLHTFNLADIGEGITECEVIKWSVHTSLCIPHPLLTRHVQVRQGALARAEFRCTVRGPERQGERGDHLAV